MNAALKRILIVAALIFLASPDAFAASTANSYIAPQTPNIGATKFLQGTDSPGTYKTIYTGAANGSKCFALFATTNDDSASHQLTIRITTGGNPYDATVYTFPVFGGPANLFNTSVNLMSSIVWPGLPTDVAGNSYIYLKSGDILGATFATALTATNQINFIAFCGDF